MAISNIIGPPVEGEDFYGRVKELTRANALLDSGHSIILSAPRRIGKSSFAKRLLADKEDEGWKCVYVDLEGVETKEQFLQELTQRFNKSKIWGKASKATEDLIRGIAGGVKEIGPMKFDFQTAADTRSLYQILADAIDHKKDTLIVMDELPSFLNILDQDEDSKGLASFFLSWFRSLRQVSGTRIRWIFCGSVGLHNYTRTRNLSKTINDLAELNFDEMSEDEAKGLVRVLAASDGVNMDDASVETFISTLGWLIPYFVQLLFTTIKENVVSGEYVSEEVIKNSMKDMEKSDYLNTWSERLAEYNGQETGARFLLDTLSASEKGYSKPKLMKEYMAELGIENRLTANNELTLTLNMLEHDGYIIRAEDGARDFRSPLLKSWWRHTFVD